MPFNLLGSALEALPSPLTILDTLGNITYVNQAWKRFADSNNFAMTHYGVGHNYVDYCEQARGEQSPNANLIAQGINDVISGIKDEFISQYPCHSLTENIWFQMHVVPLDYLGSRHAMVIHNNISEQIATETSLLNSERRLNLVLNNMPALIGYWNAQLINEFGNNAYIEMFGIDPVNIKGKHIREVIGEQLYNLNLTYIEKVLNGEPQLFERAITDPSGKVHFTLASYIPDIDNNSVNGFYVLVTDITQIKQAEIELRKSEQTSRMMLDISIEGFNFVDLNGRFIDANESFCQMLGYTRAEILDMCVNDIEYLENPEQTARHLQKITTESFDRFETIMQTKDGKLVDVEVSVAYLSDKKQYFSFTRDITQRKQAEHLRIQELKQQRDTLIREVHHRIKNHLQGMVGLLGLYSYKNPNEQELIQDIATKIASIAVVYGVQGANNQDKSYLCEITSEICKCLEIFGKESINITFTVNDGQKALLPSEQAVPIALIVNELMINAIKHNSNLLSKHVAVTLCCKEHSAVLTIQNNSNKQHVFPSFEHGIGLGVGLTLVRSMLPKHGACLSLAQHQDNVCAQLTLESPIISMVSS